MPTLTQGRLWVLTSSLLVSIAVLGVSITLLHAETPSSFQRNHVNAQSNWPQPQPQPQPQPTNLSARDSDDYNNYNDDANDFHASEILAIVSSALNLLLGAALIIAPTAMKKKTIFSAVAVETPCIYIMSFMWLATGAYAEHLVTGVPGYPQLLGSPECIRHRVMEGFAFLNWIQLMLYANTLMTVATICHVRKRSVWLLPVSELPSFGAPALTFDSEPDTAFDPSFIRKADESETPILGASRPNVSPRTPSHFRSRLAFPQFPNHRPSTLSAVPSVLSTSESVESLVPSESRQNDVDSLNLRSSMYHRVVPTGEPPTYSGPGAGYEIEAM